MLKSSTFTYFAFHVDNYDEEDLQEEIGKLLSILLRKNSDIHLENLNETSETNIQTREAS